MIVSFENRFGVMRILVADTLHINHKNYESLINLRHSKKCHVNFGPGNKEMWLAYGDYVFMKEKMKYAIDLIQEKSQGELRSLTYKNIRLFELIKSEILSYVIPKKEWFKEYILNDNDVLFELLWSTERYTLVLNMAAAIHWIDNWSDFLRKQGRFNVAVIFSGSLIYQRSLIEILKKTATRVFVTEYFFTGQHFYMEESYYPIANSTGFRYGNIQYLCTNATSANASLATCTGSVKSILTMNNLNVKQPQKDIKWTPFGNNNKTALLIGQVVNDFSILESGARNLSTIDIYKNLISELVSIGCNVIFKSHPWEKQKENVNRSLTFEEISRFVVEQHFEESVLVVQDMNIDQLMEYSNYLLVINSQAAMEGIVKYGFKPIQLGNAFYGNSGFTYDVDSPKQAAEIISLEKDGRLKISEYKKFSKFIHFLLNTWMCHINIPPQLLLDRLGGKIINVQNTSTQDKYSRYRFLKQLRGIKFLYNFVKKTRWLKGMILKNRTGMLISTRLKRSLQL